MKTVGDLKKKLEGSGIRKDAYCLPGQYPGNETYVLEKGAMDRFMVYYYERGQRSDLVYYDTEVTAINAFYEKISTDKSVYG